MKLLISLLFVTLTIFGCGKQDNPSSPPHPIANVPNDEIPEEPVTTKDTLSTWVISNEVYSVDLRVANLNGDDFTLVVRFADNSEIICPNTAFLGNDSNGFYNISGTCTSNGGISNSLNGTFETSGSGTFTNTGTSLILCKPNGLCSIYH